MKRAIRTNNGSTRRWFALIGLLAAPAASFASPQDFRSPLIVSPYSVSFGDAEVGKASPPQTATLLNMGPAAVHINSIAITGDFTQTNDCPSPPATLAINGACQIQIVFQPATPVKCSGTLTISSDTPARSLTITLNGTGAIGGTELEISPLSLNFSPQKIGTASAPRNITLSNKSDRPIFISSIGAKGDYTILPSSTCATYGGSLAANSSCTLAVIFSPLQPEERPGEVTITDSAEKSPQTIPLTGTGSQ